ncbi:MAG: Transcriptional regulator, IclR family [Holophagaceae bacterium]|nr:Transcriptional regulator, IclR family [Holophagaceae bacterium]
MELKSKSPAPTKKHGEKLQVLFRSNDVLMALNNHPEGLSIREIGHYVKLPRSTVRRILDTFEELNIVITSPSTNAYRLGPTLALYASNIRPFDIAKIARPTLMQLAGRTDESVYLCVMAHGMAVVVDLIPGVYPIHTVTTMGTSLPLHATACGKALLAALPEEELDSLRTQLKLVALTKNTITDWERLDRELETIRNQGFAIDLEEHQMGTIGIALPIMGPSREIGVISIPMPTERYHIIGEQLIQFLQHGTQNLRWQR